MRKSNLKAASFAALAAFSAQAKAGCNDDKTRVTVAVPVAVTHTSPSLLRRGWNDGIGQNLGAIVQADREFKTFSENSCLRAGPVGGWFENSLYRTSFLFGGNIQYERYLSDKFRLEAGARIGFLSGYTNHLKASIVPYVGGAHKITPNIDLGVRIEWLPGKTAAAMMSGKTIGKSDAFALTITGSVGF